jgi:hypothetical protein
MSFRDQTGEGGGVITEKQKKRGKKRKICRADICQEKWSVWKLNQAL